MALTSMETHQDNEAKEWKALYEELGTALEKHGKQNPLGEGDFWLVDNNYGGSQHKVCVTHISFLTRPLAAEVQRMLRKYAFGWEVLFSLDKPELRPTEDDLGVLVRKSDIKEYWSAERMKAAFGADFRWDLSLAEK